MSGRFIPAALALFLLLPGCKAKPANAGTPAQAGATVITRKACGSCHVIPGIAGAKADVGPPLSHFAAGRMIAGKLPNTPCNLRLYLMAPDRVVPGNAMPDQGLTARQAEQIAAYLETLK